MYHCTGVCTVWLPYQQNNSFIGSVAVKCKRKFCLKMPNSLRKPIQKCLHFKMSYTSKCKIRNIKVQQDNQHFVVAATYLNSTTLQTDQMNYHTII